jgi:NAD(P)-dependent dehydrogenase (short-subunit alcohol dehydrogenase family)
MELRVVVSGPAPLGEKLATGLRDLGAAVELLGEGGVSTREEAIGALRAFGPIDALVHAPTATGASSFAETGEEAWIRGAEAPIWHALVLFQAAYATGASIVSVLPSIALTGAAGLVPFAAAAEGIRQLVKSAARAWGGERVRVNCITLPVEEWGIEGVAVPNRYGASLPGPNVPADIAGAIALLAGPLAGGVNGATIGVDRGTVLAP